MKLKIKLAIVFLIISISAVAAYFKFYPEFVLSSQIETDGFKIRNIEYEVNRSAIHGIIVAHFQVARGDIEKLAKTNNLISMKNGIDDIPVVYDEIKEEIKNVSEVEWWPSCESLKGMKVYSNIKEFDTNTVEGKRITFIFAEGAEVFLFSM